MIRLFVLAVAASLAVPALAQQPHDSIDQRIAMQIGTLAMQNTSLGLQVERLTAQLAAAQEKIKDLEAAKKADGVTPSVPPAGAK